jgi:SNF2 family DNA or RNA helicase
MLSGGIDSPVAGYLAMKRGISIDCVYFEAIPHTSLEARNKVIELSKKCPYRLILNGTPISRNEADLFSQFFILDWRILGYQSYYSFAANHLEFKTIRLPNGREYVDRNRVERVLNVDYLSEKIAPYTFQIRKGDCLKLPEKVYSCETFDMTPEQEKEYDSVEERYIEAVDEIRSETIYKLFTACQHVVSGRHVLTGPEEHMVTAPIFQNPADNPRVEALMRAVQNLGDEKAIIFCKYQHEIDTLLPLLPGAVEFSGRVPQAKRQENRERFRGDAQFLVANKACGAFGLNLQFCHNVVFFNNDFNLATRLQAEDRVHRLGQTSEVRIWDVECTGSIDTFILDCLRRKENLAEAFKRLVKEAQKEGLDWRKYIRKKMSTRQPAKESDSSSTSSKR